MLSRRDLVADAQRMQPIVNMLCDLNTFSLDARTHTHILAKTHVVLSNQRGASGRASEWIASTFGGTWPQEAQAGWNWFALDRQNVVRGFATYEQRAHTYWWLAEWLDKPDVGIFGPMGVDQALRGQGVGTVLTQRALQSLKDLGFARALIPAVGPVEFYERCCGARVIQQLERPR